MLQFKLSPKWLQFLIIVLLIIGVFFRFCNLGGKVYWHDETYTSLRISGYTAGEVRQQIFNNRVVVRENFAKFQRINPEKNLGDTLKSLAVEDPQHPPLYYVIARFWVQLFGNSVTAIRSLSAFISLLIFPCIYWLCRELFKVPLSVPMIAIALMAISPIHVIYAQESREYILWAVTILLCNASLLRAVRLEESKEQKAEFAMSTWGIYAVTLALSLYTFLLSGFVAVAHGIYVFANAKFRWNQTVKNYAIASLAAFLAFMPWILVVIANFFSFKASTAWTKESLPLVNLIQSWLIQLSRIFWDFDFGFENPLSYLITPLFFILVGYSIYFLYRTTHQKTWLFIVTLIAVPAIPLMLPDLIFGGVRSTNDRYLLPSYLGIQISVAYLLATQLYTGSLARRKIWQIITALVIIGGIFSCVMISQADTWWSKVISYSNPQVARIINQTSAPLLISDYFSINYGNVFSLSYLTEPNVRFLLVKGKTIPKIPDGFSDVFLLNPSKTWRTRLEQKYKSKIVTVYSDNKYSLWKLAKPRTSRQTNIPPRKKLPE